MLGEPSYLEGNILFEGENPSLNATDILSSASLINIHLNWSPVPFLNAEKVSIHRP